MNREKKVENQKNKLFANLNYLNLLKYFKNK